MSRVAALLVLLAVPLLADPAGAATFRVGPAQPYSDLQAVADQVSAGDTIEIYGDHTYSGGFLFSRSGAPGNPIVVRGVPVAGKRPVLSGGTNTIEAAGDHTVFENLDITAGSFRCFYHHADDIVLRGSVIHDCPAHGLLGADADSGSLLLEYTEVHGCGSGDRQHQIYMATDESAHPGSVFRMQFCYVHDGVGGNNVKSRAERNEIYYNWIEGAYYHELELIGPDGQDPSLAREDSDVVGNVLCKRRTTYVVRFGGDGTGETDGRYRFVANTVVVQPGGSAVFRLFDGIDSLEAHDNVFVAAGGGAVNMLREAEAAWVSGRAVAGGHNWVPSGATNVPPEWTDTRQGADPGLADLAGDDVRPLAGSPLVDQGLASPPSFAAHPFPSPLVTPLMHPPLGVALAPGAAQARPAVGALDIGAYEYGTPAGTPDAGPGAADAAPGAPDAAPGAPDAAPGAPDAGAADPDAGSPSADAAAAGSDGAAGSGDAAAGASDLSSDAGCGCRAAGRGAGGAAPLVLALAALLQSRRRRRRPRGA